MQNVKTMSSREIATLTKKDHSHVIRDIRSMLSQIDDPNMDDTDFKEVFDGRGYTSEINLNKDLTLTLVAGYNSRFRYLVIKRWQELEQQAQASSPVTPALPNFTNPADAAIAWAEEYKAKEAAQAQVTELKPKAEALARISSSKGATGIRDTAKAVGMRQNDFVAWCVDDTKPMSRRFMYRDDRGVLNAYSHRTSAGLMTQKLQSFVGHDGRDRAEPRVKFTPAGVAKIAEMLEKERNKELEPM
ncbi:phage antirepressor KilAC domain-containing protein [Psychrobacter pocilloporae]|uniref:phage antirepressor KilAC domain-containing protein n=1 Tax=Psychrobacter pocilloporae TaxID=1775882 RepID=UPI003C303876